MKAALAVYRPSRRRTTLLVDPIHADDIVVRRADGADAEAIHALIDAHVDDGHLLPRRRDEIAAHGDRFLVAEAHGRIVACADLAPLSQAMAEVRSLVVHPDAQSMGIGRRMLDGLKQRASAMGFATLCAFTHAPGYFLGRGFSIVPHAWVPEKIQADCRSCPRFRHCGQYAVVLPLAAARDPWVPLTSLHG